MTSIRRLLCLLAFSSAVTLVAQSPTAALQSWKASFSAPSTSLSVVIAAAPNGDIYACDTRNSSNDLLKFASGGSATPTAIPLPSGFGCDAVAVDASGNVYIGGSDNASPFKGLQAMAAGTTTITTPTISGVVTSNVVSGVYVAGGELYVYDSTGSSLGSPVADGVLYKVPVGAAGGAATVIFSQSSVQTIPPTAVAADAAGNVFVASKGRDDPAAVQVLPCTAVSPATCTGTGGTWASTFTTINGPGGGNDWGQPQQLAVDAAGNLYVANSEAISAFGLTKVANPAGSPTHSAFDTAFIAYTGIAIDSQGDLFWAANPGSGNSTITELGAAAVNFRGQTVGTAATIPVTFTLGATGTTGTTEILTQGASAGAEFTDGSSSTCSNLAAPASCVVNVKFTPAHPGPRLGAVVLVDGSGNRIATAYVTGTGLAAALDFVPAAPAVQNLVPAISNQTSSGGVLVNASGTVYHADNGTSPGTVKNGSTVVATASSGLVDQIAEDGAGNIYFAEPTAGKVARVDAKTGALTEPYTLVGATGVAIDGFGDIFIANSSQITEEPGNGGSAVNFTSLGSATPRQLASDGQGNIIFSSGASPGGLAELNVATGAVSATVDAVAGSTGVTGVALDAGGAAYSGDTQTTTTGIERFATLGATAASIFSTPKAHALALDGSANLYYTDNADQTVDELTLATPPSLTFASTAVGATSATQTVAVLNPGNAALSFATISVSSQYALDASSTCSTSTPVAVGGSCTLVLKFAPTTEPDVTVNGTAVLADNANGGSGVQQTINLNGTVAEQVPTKLAYETAATAIYVGGNLGNAVKVDIQDANGFLDADETSSVTIAVTGPNSFNQSSTASAAVAGVATIDVSGIALPTAGTYTLTASDGALVTAVENVTVTASSAALGAIAVGSSSASTSVTVLIPTAGTVGSIAVLTQGVSGKDFTDGGSDTCNTTTNYAAGATCTVNVVFSPKAPGLRRGAVVLYRSNVPAATVFLSGTGLAGEATFPGATPATLVSGGSSGMATDGANLYYVVPFSGTLQKVALTGGAITQVGSGLPGNNGGSASLAVDGAGNVFVFSGTSSGNYTLYEFVNHNGTFTLSSALFGPVSVGNNADGLAVVDGSGNLFVSDGTGNHIVEFPADGGAAFNKDQSGATVLDPTALALDSAGNLYFNINSNPGFSEIAAGTTVVTRLSPTNFAPTSSAFDAAGNFYIIPSFNNHQVLEYAVGTFGVSSPTPSVTYNIPGSGDFALGLVVDASGNIYYADLNHGVIGKIDVRTPPAFAFSNTQPDGLAPAAQSATLGNTGSAALTVSSAAVTGTTPADFTDSGTCKSIGSVAAGSNCTVSIVWKPSAAQTYSDNETITDNDLNAANSTQPIAISGTSLATSLTASSGTPQTARVGTQFGSSLVVHVATTSGGVQGLAVTLAVPGSGASATVATNPVDTDASGNATFTLTANATASSNNIAYSVTASAPDTASTAAFSLLNVNPAAALTVVPSASDVVSGTPFNVVVTAVDSSANTDPFYTGTVSFTSTDTGAVLPGSSTLTAGVGTFPITLRSRGDWTVTANGTAGNVPSAISGTSSAVAVQPLAVSFGAQPVGVISTTQSVTFVGPAAQVGSIAVLTNGVTTAADFVIASGGSCTTGTNGAQCTVNYTFQPSAVGLRQGAVVLFDTSSPKKPLATILLTGTGSGALGAFAPVVHSSFAAVSGGSGIATDGTFVYASTFSSVSKVKISDGTVTATGISTGGATTEVSVDGAGNLYVNGNLGVQEFPRLSDGTYGTAKVIENTFTGNQITVMTVDPSGNVFVVVNTGQDLIEYPNGATSSISIYHNTSNPVTGLGVDQGGNLYYSVNGIPQEVTAAAINAETANPAATGQNSGIQAAGHYSFDAAGDLFAGSNGGATLVEYPNPSGTLSGTPTTIATVAGAVFFKTAVDAQGNVYSNDQSAGNVVQVGVQTAPALAFGSQDDGLGTAAQTFAYSNIGNAALSFSSVAAGTAQYAQSGGTCTSTATVAIGDQCTASFQFTPTSAGAHSDTVTLTSTAKNSPQTVGLSGSGLATTLAISGGNNQSAHINAAFSTPLQVTVTDSQSHPVADLSVTFATPAGAFATSATVTTNSSGVATANTYTANATATLNYGITASAPDAGNSVSFTETNIGNATKLAVSVPATEVAGTAFNATVSALDENNQVDTTFSTDTIAITSPSGSGDPQAVLPAPAALTAGAGTFSVTLKTAGNRTIEATDSTNGLIAVATSNPVAVTPAAATSLRLAVPVRADKGVAFNVAVTAFDPFGNKDTNYAGTVTLTSSDAAATLPAGSALTSGTHSFSVTLNTGGPFTVSATGASPALPAAASNAILDFPFTGAVGAKFNGSSFPVTFTFGTAQTVAAIHVLTQGAANQDYTLDGTPGTCTARAYGPPSNPPSCTVNVDFTPAAAGVRPGAVVLADASGKALQTFYLSGVGTGAAPGFSGARPLGVVQTGLVNPAAVVRDGSGNTYIADLGTGTNGAIILVPSGQSSGSALAFTPAQPLTGLAVDGAGNLFVGESNGTSGGLVKIPFEGTAVNPADATTPVTAPVSGLAADGEGNVFYTDPSNDNGEFELTPAGTHTQIQSNFSENASPIATDSLGNIYTVYGTGTVSKVAANTFSHTDVATGVGSPTSIAVDAAGDIYLGYAQAAAAQVTKIAAGTGTVSNLLAGSVTVNGLALDSAGNVYTTQTTGTPSFNEIVVAAPPSGAVFAFGDVPVNPKTPPAGTSVVSNIGNATLSITNLAVTPSQYTNTSTCTSTTTLSAASGQTCTLAVTFSPDSAAAFNGSATLTDNSYAGATQAANLSGQGVKQLPTIALTPSPAASNVYGTDVTVGVAITSTQSNIPASAAGIYTVDGGSANPITITSGAATIDLGNLLTVTGSPHAVVVTYTADTTFATANQSQNISTTAKSITPAFIGTVSKTYDGTNTATLAASNFSLPGVLAADAANVTAGAAAATYSQVDRGTLLTVSATGIALSGSRASNYSLSTTSASQTGMGTINPVAVTPALTGTISKTYDGSNTATLAPGNFSLPGVLAGDALNVTPSSPATYSQAGAGSSLTVSASAITLSGSKALDYALTATTASLAGMGTINKAVLTVALANQSYPYGTSLNAQATFTTPTIPGQYSLTGFVNGETVATAGVSGGPVLTTAATSTSSVNGGPYTISIGSTTLAAANYSFNTSGTANLTITPLTLTTSLTGALNKTYDGTTAFTGLTSANYDLSGAINGDTVALASFPATGVYDSALVATNPNHVTASGLSLTNNPGGNYTLPVATAVGLATISPKAVTATIIGNPTDVYHASAVSNNILTAANYQLNGVVAADASNVHLLSTPLSGTFNDPTVAGATTITVSGLGIGGTASGNYTLTPTSASGPATITKATITPSLTGTVTKVYDGASTATVAAANISLPGLLAADTASVIPSATAASYSQSTVGSNLTVAATGIAITGSAAGNYILASTAASAAIGSITGKPVTAALAGAVTKTYDGTNAATLALSNISLTGVLAGDAGNVQGLGTATYSQATVGSGLTVNASGIVLAGSASGNYALSNATASAAIGTITAKAITPALTGTATKAYDGSNTATLSAANFSLPGVVSGDAVTAASPASYVQATVGNGLTVSASAVALGGAASGNYALVATTASGPIGSITAKTLQVTLVGTMSKVYDGTTTLSLSPANYQITGVIGSDQVLLDDPTVGNFLTKDVGGAITVTATGLTISGSAAGNYVLAGTSASGPNGAITPATLTASLTGVVNKTYDGITTIGLNPGNYVLSGVLNGDDVSLTGTGTGNFADVNAGTNKPISAFALGITGAAAGNYTLASTTATGATGTIFPATLLAQGSNATRVYGAANPTVTGGLTGNILSDGITVSFATAATPTTPVGTYSTGANAVVPTLSDPNNRLSNYTVTLTPGAFTIAPATLNVTANDASRAYGAANPTFAFTVAGFVNGETSAILTGAPTLTTVAVPGNSVGTFPIAIAQGTLAAPNYNLVLRNGTLTITPAALSVSANNVSRVYGAANPTLPFTVSGFLNGDSTGVLSGSPARTTTATAASGVGSYPITIAQGTFAATNYGFLFTNGLLTVTPATLTVTANNATRIFGAANPAFSASLAGFVNGDGPTSVAGAASLTTAATAASNVGTYPITASQGTLAATNYGFAFVPGTLTVTPAAQNITFPAIGFTVPGSVVTLQATASSGLAIAYKVVSGSASVSGSQLTILGPGAITVEADQAGNGNFTAATPVTQTFSAGAPAAGLSTAALAFGSQTVNTPSAAQTVVVTNSGSSALHITSATAAAPFSASTNCAAVAVGASCTVSVTFTPTATGAASGTLSIADDASGSPQTVTLAGSGTAPGIALAPATLVFGGQPVATASTAQSLTITNTGSSDLHIASVVASGANAGDFAAAGSCSTVAAGSSCSLNITFTPSATGARAAIITLTDAAAGGSQTVAVSGTGTAAGIAIAPTALAFPATLNGTTSFPQTVTVANSGTAALTALAASISGDFAIQSNNCPAALAAGASCAINLTYTPTLAGAESGSLTLSDSLGTQPVALTGTGLAPGANLSAASVIFGGQLVGTTSPAQTVALTNSGTGPLTIAAVVASAGFSDTTNCAGSLAAGASCSINLAFTPSAAGGATGTVTVTDAAGTQTIAAAGSGNVPGLGLTPSAVQFGAEPVGTASDAQTLTLTNTGTVTLALDPRTAFGDFAESDNCPASFVPGASCQISLVFIPGALGQRTGAVQVTSGAGLAATAALQGTGTLPGIAASPASVYFGSQAVGVAAAAQTVTIANTGSAPLTISSVQTDGDFAQVNTCTGSALAPGAQCVVSVTLTPSTIGARTGTLTIYDNADGTHAVALSGLGQAAGASLAPSMLAFGSAPVPVAGSAVTLTGTPQTVTLTNTGNIALNVGAVAVNGDFTQSNTCGASLAAGASCSINVAFAPTGLGHRSGTLTVANQTVTLGGFGSPTGLVLSPSALNFGGTKVGTPSAPQTATLTNKTGSDISNLVIAASGEFTQTNTCNGALANGANCTLSITLTPLTQSAVTGAISISGGLVAVQGGGSVARSSLVRGQATSSSSGLAVIAMTGSGNPAAIELSGSSLTFSPQAVGTASAAQTVTITNTGTSDALTSLALASTPDFPLTTTCAATLAAGANCTAAVTFQPTAAGARTGALTITAAGGLQATVALGGQGNGGVLTVTPSSLAFGARPVGTASAAQTVTLTNTGSAALSLQTLAVSAGDFSLASSTCGALPATLAANASCTAAVVFTPSSAAASAGTLSVTSNFGNALIALSGSGNSQGLALSATSLAFAHQGVGLASTAQTLTLTNQNASAVAITSIAASGDFSQSNNCPASLAAAASCAVQVTFLPTAAGARNGTITVADSGATQSVALSGTGTNFTLGASAGPVSQQIAAGGSATFQLLLTPGAFNGPVSLSCSGLPASASCGFTPQSVTLTANGAPVGVALTISTGSRTAALPALPPAPSSPGWPTGRLWFALALVLLLAGLGFGASRRKWATALLLGAALASAACGGVSNQTDNNHGTPPGTYTVTVTATAGQATQTTAVTLTVL